MNIFLRSSLARALVINTFLILAISAPSRVDGAVLINEVRPWHGSTGLDEESPSAFWLLNTGVGSQNLFGWEVRNYVLPDFTIVLPSITLPPEAYLQVVLGSGVDDLDFSDGEGIHYAGIAFLCRPSGELGLYTGASDNTIVDYVRWGTESSSSATGQTHAAAQGLWSPSVGEFVELANYDLFTNMARVPSGYDNNVPADFQEYSRRFVVPFNQHKGLQLFPLDASLRTTVDTLEWRSVASADSYLVEVDNDSTFSSVDASAVTNLNHAAVNLPDDHFFWRVTPYVDGVQLTRRAIWRFTKGVLGVQTLLPSPFPVSFQRRDTKLLCLYKYRDPVFCQHAVAGFKEAKDKRPACSENPGPEGPWNAPHPANANHIQTCRHCGTYCARACIQMINGYFRIFQEGAGYGAATQLRQDEISYYLNWKKEDANAPEDDLGHGDGADAMTNNELVRVLGGAGVTKVPNAANPNGALQWATLTDQIDDFKPVLITVKNGAGGVHAEVIIGYGQAGAKRQALVADPWPPMKAGPPAAEWVEFANMPITEYFLINPPANAIFAVEGSNDIKFDPDFDGDGILNFDEGWGLPWIPGNALPRRIMSHRGVKDTDGDSIDDLEEIRSYTFHDTHHKFFFVIPHDNDPLGFPDVDNDGARAENDVNTDGDRLSDDFEDINLNGSSPDPGETCVYRKADANGKIDGFCYTTPWQIAPQGVTNYKIHIPKQLAVIDVDLLLTFKHGKTPALLVDLISPKGTQRRILDRFCNGQANINRALYGHWDDAAGQEIQCQANQASYGGWYKPKETLARFNGELSKGDWIVRFEGVDAGYVAETDTVYYACLIIKYDRAIADDQPRPKDEPRDPAPHLADISAYALYQCYPNPFNPTTRITFDLLEAGHAEIIVFDVLGREVARPVDRTLPAGRHTVDFDASRLATGVYWYRLRSGEFEARRKMLLLK